MSALKLTPSQLPPPSRPPPALDVEKRDSCKSTPNCQSAASSGSAGDSSPPYFDVEEEGVVFKTLQKLGSKNDRKDREGRVVKLVDMSDGTKYEGEQGTCESEENGMDDRQKVTIPDSLGKRHLNTAKKSDEKHGRESLSPQGSDKIDEAGEWKEATQFFELVRTNVPRKVVDLANNDNCFLQNTNIHEQGQKEKTTQISMESSRLKLENGKKVQAITADHELEEYANNNKVSKPARDLGGSNGRSEAAKVAHREKGLEKKVQVAQEVLRVEDEEKLRMDKQQSLETDKRQTRADGSRKHELMGEVPRAQNKHEGDNGAFFEKEENEKQLKAALEQLENERRQKKALKQKGKEKRIKEAHVREETEKRQRDAYEKQEEEKRLRAALEQEENERRLKEALVKEENERKLKEIHEKEEYERRLREVADREENERRQRGIREREEKRQNRVLEKKVNERRIQENEGRLREARQREEDEKILNEALEHENKKKQREVNEKEGNEKKCKEVFENERIGETLEQEATEKQLEETNEQDESGKLRETPEGEVSELGTCKSEEMGDASQETRNLENNEVKLKDGSEIDKPWILNEMGQNCRVVKQACKTDVNRNLGSTRLAGKHERKNGKQEVTGEVAHEEIGKVPPGLKISDKEEAVETVSVQVDGKTKVSGVAQGNLEHENNQSVLEDDVSVYGDERMRKAGEAGNATGQKSIERTKKAFQLESDIANQGKEFARDRSDRRKNIPQAFAMNHEDRKDNFMSTGAVKKNQSRLEGK
ncbi:hypothetical protein OIU76_024413 [Salix suchowensis]|nr:hypothetical protein OIU76_024413 [Salix suchowensis]